jgi:hypothetical protein
MILLVMIAQNAPKRARRSVFGAGQADEKL